MSTKVKIILVSLVLLLVGGCATACSAIGWSNSGIRLENSVSAQYSSNQNEYDAFWKKVKESAQIPDKYKDGFKDLLVSEVGAKFGPEGSKAAFQWFKDRDINFDSSVYRKIQDLIEVGRNDFKRGQNELLSKQQRTKDHYQTFPGTFFGNFFNQPRTLSGKLSPKEDLDGDGVLTVFEVLFHKNPDCVGNLKTFNRLVS